MMGDLLLEVRNLASGYKSKQGDIVAVDHVSFSLRKGEFLGLAGESGCGKSTLAYTLLGLLPSNGKVFGGEVHYQGRISFLWPKKNCRLYVGVKSPWSFNPL